jgi:sugar transferase (PEP-CTERM/EpsH1 system associated)
MFEDRSPTSYQEIMRILFIAHRVPYPPNKGEKLRAFWELRELSKSHTVDLFCFYDDSEDAKYARELSQYCHRLYLEKVSFLGSRMRAIAALLRGQPFTAAFFHSGRMERRINLALRSGYYDRIFVYSSSMAHYVRAAGKIPKVLDLVDVDSDKWQQYANHSSWPWTWLWRREARALGAYEESLVRDFSSTVVCTEAEAQLLRSKASHGRIEVLQNFLDVDAYRPANPLPEFIRAWQPYVIFTGSMDYRPNIDAVRYFCREVFPLIQRAMPKVRLIIAGRNPDRSVLALKVDSSIEVTGSVPDMKPYIWGASTAVVPMRIARGIQNKIIEALAGGVPVVSTTAAASALSPTLRSLLRVADSPQDISAAIIRLLRNGSEISSSDIREALKSYIDNLNLPALLQRLVNDPAESLGTNDESTQRQVLVAELNDNPHWESVRPRAS